MTAANDTASCRSCGRPRRKRANGTTWVGSHGWCEACCKRWREAGCPPDGPPPGRAGTVLPPVPDLYELQWYAGEGERRVMRARPRAAALAQCVAARDAHGVEILLSRLEDQTAWAALAVVLAECADPERVAEVCGTVMARTVAA